MRSHGAHKRIGSVNPFLFYGKTIENLYLACYLTLSIFLDQEKFKSFQTSSVSMVRYRNKIRDTIVKRLYLLFKVATF